jgi:hypothetical protein
LDFLWWISWNSWGSEKFFLKTNYIFKQFFSSFFQLLKKLNFFCTHFYILQKFELHLNKRWIIFKLNPNCAWIKFNFIWNFFSFLDENKS